MWVCDISKEPVEVRINQIVDKNIRDGFEKIVTFIQAHIPTKS